MQLGPGGKSSSGDEDGAASRVFKRYKLSDEKQFSSLFFDEKEKLLALLKHFLHKSGKYSVQVSASAWRNRELWLLPFASECFWLLLVASGCF